MLCASKRARLLRIERVGVRAAAAQQHRLVRGGRARVRVSASSRRERKRAGERERQEAGGQGGARVRPAWPASSAACGSALIWSRSACVASRAASAKSAPPEAYRIAREELIRSPVPAAVWPLRTAWATSPPWAPTPGTSSGMSPDDRAHLGQLARVGGADHQQAVAARVPARRGELGHRPGRARRPPTSRSCRSRAPGLEVRHRTMTPLVRVPQERLERIAAEVGIHRDRVRAVALEGLDGVALGGVADVAALGVEDHRHAGVGAVDVLDGALELVLRLVGGVVRELRLVGADQVAPWRR